jgi:hypothetical protein
METDMNSTTKQSNNSAKSNEIRSLNDEEIDLVSGGMSDFIWTVRSACVNAAIMTYYGPIR